MNGRVADRPVDSLFLRRWSPRAFTGEPIDEATLFSLFEAARWAPSGNNAQPWRFIYARNGGAAWNTFLGLLTGSNRTWATNASALVLLLSRTTYVRAGAAEPAPHYHHAFDAGAAWASLAFQATLLGWHTRAIGGYDQKAARLSFGVPADYELQVAIAIGRQADVSRLPETLRDRERPTSRRPLSQIVAEGSFNFAE